MKKPLEDLLSYINHISPLSGQAWDCFQAILQPAEYQKGEVLLAEGKVCSYIYFIRQGYCRSFIEKEGEEINTAFFFEKDFATNVHSLGSGVPSAYTIQACEPAQVFRFHKNELLQLYRQSAEIESFGRKLLELMLAQQEAHTQLFKLYSAQERYQYLLEHHPHILQRVPLSQIASYLGVKRETLSRIRNKNRTA